MIIEIPKEIKNNENRAGITPVGVSALVNSGHSVYIEQNPGKSCYRRQRCSRHKRS